MSIHTLYEYEAKKVAIFGLGTIDCTLRELAKFGSSSRSACLDDINDVIQLFSDRLKLFVDDLNVNFFDANFTYLNIFGIGSMDATTLVCATLDKKKEYAIRTQLCMKTINRK